MGRVFKYNSNSSCLSARTRFSTVGDTSLAVLEKLEKRAQNMLLLAKLSQHHMFLFGIEVHAGNTERSINTASV